MSYVSRRPVDSIDRRVGVLFGVFLLLLVIAVARAGYLGVFRSSTLKKMAATQQIENVTIPAVRGEITDRNGVPLALSESADEVVADPYLIKDPQQTATVLAPLLGITTQAALAGLTKPHTGYSILARDVPAASATKLMDRRIDGISATPVSQRVYPRGDAATQVLGWVGASGKGGGGIEYLLNRQLQGAAGHQRIVNDAKGDAISVRTVKPMAPGKEVGLTISAPLQSEVEQVLDGIGTTYKPKSATAIVMNPQTDQIMALANWPEVNANNIGATPFADTEDSAVGMSYEPGSTFKAITVAGALQSGFVTPATSFDVPPDLQAYGKTIHDAEDHGYEEMSVADILKVSSNIGADLIGQREGAKRFDYWVHQFGFGKPTGVSLPGEQTGIVDHWWNYNGLSMYNMPFGQGVDVTPMQMVAAYSAIADGGVLRSPQIVQSIGGKAVPQPTGKRIISPHVALEIRQMLRGVLADGGTASGAAIPGYDLAGKTGTANVAVDGKYSDTAYVASFIGMVPASDPKLVVAVVVNQPQGAIYGGSVAAPAFQKIVGWAVPYLGINPCPSPCPASAMQPAMPSTP